MKLVSVIVPVYNREKVIMTCYLSICNQTYKNIEIIFVDDGSSDKSLEILNSIKDDRVIVISQKNSGPSEARRNGLKHSHGEYITFVDSDDTIALDFIFRMVNTLSQSDASLCVGRIGLHVDNSIIKPLIFKCKKRPNVINLLDNPEYLPILHQGVVAKLFKREILDFKKIEFRANEDLVFMYPLYCKIEKIVYDNLAIYHNYYSRNSQRNLLFGYKFENIYNTFGTLNLVYEELIRIDKLELFHDEVEMLFIRNILERVNNISNSVNDKIYRSKFISVLFLYLEYYFPNWNNNKYYMDGFKLAELTDRLRMKNANKIIKSIDLTSQKLVLNEIYEKYKDVERLYEKAK